MKIAVLGYGTVGSGLCELIDRLDSSYDISIVGILVSNKKKYKDVIHCDLITDDPDEIFEKKPDLIVEVLGGVEIPYKYSLRAIKNKIHLVSANKKLIAHKGPELIKAADEYGVCYRFEASVAGGIPIISPLVDSTKFEKIEKVMGILNGTSNYILSSMAEDDLYFEEALKEAQEEGFAEADPTDDVDGYDAANKLAILSTIAYNGFVDVNDIEIVPISGVKASHIEYLKNFGLVIKPVSYSSIDEDEKIYAFVGPAIVPEDVIYGTVLMENNCVSFKGDISQGLDFVGKGAGKFPTASAVLRDILDIYRGDKGNYQQFLQDKIKFANPEDKTYGFYVFSDQISDYLESIDDEFYEKFEVFLEVENNMALIFAEGKSVKESFMKGLKTIDPEAADYPQFEEMFLGEFI